MRPGQSRKQLPERLREALRRSADEEPLEKRIFDEFLLQHRPQSTPKSNDLLVQMATRLRRLESSMQVLRKDLLSKEKKLKDLEEENANLSAEIKLDFLYSATFFSDSRVVRSKLIILVETKNNYFFGFFNILFIFLFLIFWFSGFLVF